MWGVVGRNGGARVGGARESLWSPEVTGVRLRGGLARLRPAPPGTKGDRPLLPGAIRRSALGVLRSTPGGTKLERPLRLKGQQNGEGARVNGGAGGAFTGSTKSRQYEKWGTPILELLPLVVSARNQGSIRTPLFLFNAVYTIVYTHPAF